MVRRTKEEGVDMVPTAEEGWAIVEPDIRNPYFLRSLYPLNVSLPCRKSMWDENGNWIEGEVEPARGLRWVCDISTCVSMKQAFGPGWEVRTVPRASAKSP